MDRCTLLQKSTLSCKKNRLQKSGFFVDFGTVPKGGQWHSTRFSGICTCHFAGAPLLVDTVEVLRQGTGRTSKADSLAFRRCNALRLPLPDVGALVLRHKGEHLQHDVAQKSTHQVFARRVSSSGISSTTMSAPFVWVSSRHCSKISAFCIYFQRIIEAFIFIQFDIFH